MNQKIIQPSQSDFVHFAKKLLEQNSNHVSIDEQKDHSLDVSQIIQFQQQPNFQSPLPIRAEPIQYQASSEPCNCARSGCKKMYCECLAKGKLCSEECIYKNRIGRCLDCHNKDVNSLLLGVMEELDQNQERKRFRSRRFKDGCTCQKSQCLKKYCECFNAQRGCTPGCKCNNCGNQYSTSDFQTPSRKRSSKNSSAKCGSRTQPQQEVNSLKLYKCQIEESNLSEDFFDQMQTKVVAVLGQLMMK